MEFNYGKFYTVLWNVTHALEIIKINLPILRSQVKIENFIQEIN